MAVVLRERVGRRPFVSARYLIVGDRYEPEPVHVCPESVDDPRPCRLKAKDWSDRKTGPVNPMRVLECTTHKCCFTVYPMGYGPYERRPDAAVAPDGSPLIVVADDPANEALRGTKFGAVVDFLSGRRWPPDRETADEYGMPNPPGVFRTQLRHIARCVVFFGIAIQLTDEFRFETSLNLGIPTQRLIDSAKRVRDGPTWNTKASEVGAFLQALSPLHAVLHGVAQQGKAIGLWGTPLGT